jgi:hypothetical protein
MQGFPASRYQPQASRKAIKMNDGFGLRQLGLFENSDPVGCSLKTRVRSYCMALSGLSLNWKNLGTTSSRKGGTGVLHLSALVLGRSERRTSGTECGSSGDWHTPKVEYSHRTPEEQEEAKARARAKYEAGEYADGCCPPSMNDLQIQVKQDWQTPSATCADAVATSRSGDRKDELLLDGQEREAEAWATPQARDWRNGKASPETMEHNSRPLNEQVTNWPTVHGNLGNNGPSRTELGFAVGQAAPENPSTNGKPRGSLNSAWVAQLQGWPDDYMRALAAAVTEFHLTEPRAGRTKAS